MRCHYCRQAEDGHLQAVQAEPGLEPDGGAVPWGKELIPGVGVGGVGHWGRQGGVQMRILLVYMSF